CIQLEQVFDLVLPYSILLAGSVLNRAIVLLIYLHPSPSMRHLLLPVFSLFAVALHAQTPFAPVGAQWTYTQGNFGGPDSTIAVFQVLSDTMLQGRSCSRVTTTEGWVVCHELVQYLRTSNDSTYYFNDDQQRFHLLFRWNAVPGDTWSTPITQDGAADTLDWTVSDTGHVAIGGSVLRTL